MSDGIEVTGPLRRFTEPGGGSSSHYLVVSGEAAEALAGIELATRLETGKRRGFGALKVTLHLGAQSWQTSAFPWRDGSWFVPVKVAVMRAEGVSEGDDITIAIEP